MRGVNAPLLKDCCDRVVQISITSRGAGAHPRSRRAVAGILGRRNVSPISYQRLEREWFPQYDVILVASEDDRRRVDYPDVHTEARIFPNALPEITRPQVAESDAIIFSGNLEYHPNVEGVRWFRERIWPRIRENAPGIEWRLLGSNPEAVAAFTGGDPSIRVLGPVADAVAHLAEAKVCIAPLLSGSGTRFKILEAWAAGRAVVSTTLGAEGLGARDGEHLLLADDPGDFGDAVLVTLQDRSLGARDWVTRDGCIIAIDLRACKGRWKLDDAGGV